MFEFLKYCTKEISLYNYITAIYIPVSSYDIYFDSFYDTISEKGVKTNIIFGVFKDAMPLDCKIKLEDMNGNILFEEFVKKQEIPEECKKGFEKIKIKNKNNIIININ